MSTRYRVVLSRQAEKALDQLISADYRRVRTLLNTLEVEPRPPGCRKLAGPGDVWRVRAGDYRIIYTIADDLRIINVSRIGHRREVYR